MLNFAPMKHLSLETLEYPKILQRLAELTAFSASRQLALELLPTTNLALASKLLRETSEARLLFSLHSDISVGGAREVRPAAIAASRGSVLEPPVILEIKSTLVSARTLQRKFEKLEQRFPLLSEIAASLPPAPGVIEAISRVLSDQAEILEDASPKLAAIRSGLKQGHARIMSKLQRVIEDRKNQPMLQEPIITQRDGRYVVPLRAEYKGQLKSVVHDQSTSGATLFVEPLAVVELNNELRELELAERDEIRRILAELSALIGEQQPAIAATVEALARLDLIFARARLAEQMDASEPLLKDFYEGADERHPGSTIRLRQARHPLLNPAQVVPIDLVFAEGIFGLVITGPNTGGKTVALKTAGLLALMAQSGMHIPAQSGSEISVFGGIFADIGDEQSIEQSLSTFSGHIARIVEILKQSGKRSLVLLDELGAGTDPQEGAALAMAILDTLMANKVTTLVATHYPELKAHAHTRDGISNANVEFDLESLRPTYRLTIGLPGRSNALAIAERLGLDQQVIDFARQMLAPDDLRAESLLDEIYRQREAAERAQAAAASELTQAAALNEQRRAALELIDEERLRILEAARQQAGDELSQLQEEVRKLRARLTRAAQPLEEIKALEQQTKQLAVAANRPLRRTDPPAAPRPVFKVGDAVHLRTLQSDGQIVELSGEQAEILIGRLRVRARIEELEPPVGKKTAGGKRGASRSAVPLPPAEARPAASSVALEVNLIGRTVEEALDELERRMDAAYMAGMPFLRVVHGMGSGRLRQGIRRALENNPYVASFEAGAQAEGGEGVTIVRLAL